MSQGDGGPGIVRKGEKKREKQASRRGEAGDEGSKGEETPRSGWGAEGRQEEQTTPREG